MRSEKLRRLISVLEEAEGIMSDYHEIRLFATWRKLICNMLAELYAVEETENDQYQKRQNN